MEEIRLLLQGTDLPEPNLCSQNILLPPKTLSSHSTAPLNPIVFTDPVDTTGKVAVRQRVAVATANTIPLEETPTPAASKSAQSRTTKWRKRKAAEEQGKFILTLSVQKQ